MHHSNTIIVNFLTDVSFLSDLIALLHTLGHHHESLALKHSQLPSKNELEFDQEIPEALTRPIDQRKQN